MDNIQAAAPFAQQMPTQIPLEAVTPEGLPTERGLKYEEIALIVGNLYLDTRRRFRSMDEEFRAVVSEYQTRLQASEAEIVALTNEVGKLKRELARRDQGTPT